MNSDNETGGVGEMPIAEDWFWSNSECVCDKTPDNDYPCCCDMIDSSSDEEEVISDLDKKCEDCETIIENFYLNNPFGNGDRHCRECRVAEKKKEGIEVDRKGANKEGEDWYEM